MSRTFTSLDFDLPALPRAASPDPPAALTRRLAEDVLGWPMAWQLWQDVPASPFGYPAGAAPFARGASGTVNDRKGGRDLPLFWNEVDLRGFRVLSRFLWDTNPFMIGFGETLVDYHVRKGFGWQACRRGAKKTPYPTTAALTDPLVTRGQAVLDQWRDEVKWPLLSREAFKRWRRDGEPFGRFFHAGHKRLPRFRFVEPEQVGDPEGRTDGPYSFGIETEPEDQAGPALAYHLWDMESGGTSGEWVPADRVVHLKANVDSGVKRGLPDTFSVMEALDGSRKLVRNMLGTAIDLAAIGYFERFGTASGDQVKAITLDRVTSYLGQTTGGGTGPGAAGFPFFGPNGTLTGGNRFRPGTVIRTEGNREMEAGPVQEGVPSFIEVEQAALRAVCVRFRFPEYMTAKANDVNFAAALTTGSPFAVAVEGKQFEFGACWERPVALKVLEMARDAGLLTWEEWAALDVEVTAPAVVQVQPLPETQRRKILNDAGVLSIPTWQLQEQLDPQHEAENGAVRQQQGGGGGSFFDPPGRRTPPEGGGGGGGGGFGEAKPISGGHHDRHPGRWLSEHGAPPRPGLVFDDGSHHWVRPHEHPDHPRLTAGAPGLDDVLAAVADAHPDAALDPHLWQKVRSAAGKLRESVYGWMVRQTPLFWQVVPEILDTPADMAKLGYNPAASGTGPQVHDPVKDHLGIGTHLALSVASRVLAKGVAWAAGRLSRSEGLTRADLGELADGLLGLFAALDDVLGVSASPDRDDLVARLAGRLGVPGAKPPAAAGGPAADGVG